MHRFPPKKTHDSHQGLVIMASHKRIGENLRSPVNPIAWHSEKIQKVAVSTLSAEAMALSGAVDMLSWIRLYWAWICDQRCDWRRADETLLRDPAACSALTPEPPCDSQMPDSVDHVLKSLPSDKSGILTTDGKSLNGLISRNAPPSCTDFRTQLRAKLIKEHIKNEIHIRCPPGPKLQMP